jgi:hypothetical protein
MQAIMRNLFDIAVDETMLITYEDEEGKPLTRYLL